MRGRISVVVDERPGVGSARRVRSLVVAVPTFRRNEQLVALIPQLLEQMRQLSAATRLLVIDNDPDGGAESAVEAFLDAGVDYRWEKAPGIAAARNSALAASGDADALVFIDDDETPVAGWLPALVRTHEAYGGSGVVGPVISSFETETPDWVAAGGFFDRPRRATGTMLAVAATNNLLLDLDRVRSAGLTFDDRFGITGGSDTLFTRQLTSAEGPLAWCDEAVVYDQVPASRNTREWVVRRAFRSGNTWARTSVILAGTGPSRLAQRLVLMGQGLLRVVGGGAMSCVGVLSGNLARRAGGVRVMSRGAGLMAGAVDVVYSEYRRRNG